MRSLSIVLLSLVATHFSLLSATPITSMDEELSELADKIQPPRTLVLTVRDQADIPEAQRLLTLSASQDLPSLVLIELPDNTLESIAIRRAAKRYFQSDFSRPHTYFIKAEDHPYPEFKTLILSPVEPVPLFSSESFPEELPDNET